MNARIANLEFKFGNGVLEYGETKGSSRYQFICGMLFAACCLGLAAYLQFEFPNPIEEEFGSSVKTFKLLLGLFGILLVFASFFYFYVRRNKFRIEFSTRRVLLGSNILLTIGNPCNVVAKAISMGDAGYRYDIMVNAGTGVQRLPLLSFQFESDATRAKEFVEMCLAS